jgi:site-specific DNA recombinase
MLYDGKHEALIDVETFKAISSRYHNDKTKANYNLKNILAGLLVCQKCGKVMHFQDYTTRANTQARYTHRQPDTCKVKSALASDVLNAVIHSLKLYIEDFETKIDNLPDVDENSIQRQIEALQEQLRKTEKKLSKLFDAWEDGNISDNEFVQRKAVNNDKIESIKKQMEELESSIPEKEEYQEKIMSLSNALDSLLDETLDADIKNEYLKQIVDKIEFSRENVTEFILDLYLK